MDFDCPICNKTIAYDLKIIVPHTEEHIIDAIKKSNPQWVEKDGMCKKCYEYYKTHVPAKEIKSDDNG